MGDLTSKISSLLSNPEAMQQLQNMASALGLGMMGDQQSSETPDAHSSAQNNWNGDNSDQQSGGSQNTNQQNNNSSPGGLDMNALMGMLQNMGGANPQNTAPQNNNSSPGGLDMGALMGMLQNMGGSNQQNSSQSNQSGSGFPNIDFNTIIKIQQAMMAFSAGNKNVDLLRALKPHLSEKRSKKVDDAIRIMQLINLLPMIKQSGLFGFGGENK